MSEEAFRIYEDTLKEQHSRNEARRIRSRVTEARRSLHSAGPRWPFELLQNALDSGPRIGKSLVTIRLRREPSRVVFEHDGVPFTLDELAALLSGGSSKEFESDVTTGRFGTGFLVTHVLAERTNVQGLLKAPLGCERFNLVLDRSGDEDAILKNMDTCTQAIRAASPVADLDGIPSARFEYLIDNDSPLLLGFEALKSALPYLYATRQSLGRVEIEGGENKTEVWKPTRVTGHSFEDGYVEERSLNVELGGSELPEIRIFRFMTNEDAAASALVLVERTASGWKVRLPEPGAPRVYREYPLRGSGFLPVNFVFDGKFEPDQERIRLLMNDKDKELLEDAFSAAVLAVKYAFDQDWENAHLLARAQSPTSAFEANNDEERRWWTEQLAAFAKRLANLTIVECTSQTVPAIIEYGGGAFADFVIPRLFSDSAENETTVERMWHLVDADTHLVPPRKEIANDWTEIAEGWHSLGVELNRISVQNLAESVRGTAAWVNDEAKTLDQLHVEGDHRKWLAHFLDVVGECWSNRAGVDLTVLTGMLPNQNQRLCSPSELNRDDGVSDSLKNCCTDIGLDVRSRLLLGEFEEIAKEDDLAYLADALEKALPNSISEGVVIEDAVKHLDAQLPEDQDCSGKPAELLEGSARFLSFLWESTQEKAAPIAKQVPLITSDQHGARWSQNRMMMAPVRSWHESARPFSDAYPPNRILADMYAGFQADDILNCIPAMVEWGMVFADPITTDMPAELRDRRLAAISSSATEGVVVRGQEFSQIALLQPDVLNRVQESVDYARALLGLVLCHIAPHDPAWQEEHVVNGRRSGQDVDIKVKGALWLADLGFRSWVPVPGEDGAPNIKTVANATTLTDLLQPDWLEQNDSAINLLSEWFGFDELDLRLLGLVADADKRQDLRNRLAKLVELGGADPEFYTSLAQETQARQRRSRDVDRCRRFGIAVQEAIKLAMENYDLKLSLVDRGFDYEVALSADDVIETTSTKFEVGPYLLEVKATTTGGARLTPLQAETASKESSRYVLCVVDLRDVSEEELDAEWTAAGVESLARITPNIGINVEETYSLVEAAKARSVGIRNESALRYEVPVSVWESGVSIKSWVESISNKVQENAAE